MNGHESLGPCENGVCVLTRLTVAKDEVSVSSSTVKRRLRIHRAADFYPPLATRSSQPPAHSLDRLSAIVACTKSTAFNDLH